METREEEEKKKSRIHNAVLRVELDTLAKDSAVGGVPLATIAIEVRLIYATWGETQMGRCAGLVCVCVCVITCAMCGT